MILCMMGCTKNKKDFYGYSIFNDKKIVSLIKEELKGDYNLNLRKEFGYDYADRLKVSKPILWYSSIQNKSYWLLIVWLDGVDVYSFMGTQAEDGTIEITFAGFYPSLSDELKSQKKYIDDWLEIAEKTTKDEPMYIYVASANDPFTSDKTNTYVIIGDYAYDVNNPDEKFLQIFDLDLSDAHVVNFGY